MFLLIYVLDSVSYVMFVCLSLYSLLPDLWRIKLFNNDHLSRNTIAAFFLRQLNGFCLYYSVILSLFLNKKIQLNN